MTEQNSPYIFYSKDVRGQKRVTVAAIKGDGEYLFGAAVCSTQDPFVKKIGRSIAIGRAQKGITVNTLPIGVSPMKNSEFIEFADAIATTLLA